MKSLFLLVWRHNFTLLFVLLWSLSFFLVVKNNNFQQVSVFNSTNKVVASFLEVVNYVKEYVNLRENNASLARENANLKSLMPEAWYDKRAIRTLINDSVNSQQYTYVTARVVNNSVNRRNNYLTLDKGSLQGVHRDMGVISSAGVVGIVKDVSPHYCTVMSVLHKNTRISARFKQNQYFGSLVWDGADYRNATLLEVAKHVRFETGDTLVTTRYSSIFPDGVMIGVVSASEMKPGDNFYRISVRLSTHFANLSHVYIVNNLFKEEQEQLERATTQSDDN